MRVRLRVTGRVQGVGFRWWVSRKAQTLGLAGTVRNAADGSVELEVEGESAELAAMRDHVGTGPPTADVARVEELAPTPGTLPRPFRIVG